MLPNDIHFVYLKTNRDGVERHHPAGRFLVHDGQIQHLEDYYGHLKDHVPEGVIDNYTMAKLKQPPAHIEHASHDGLRNGHRPHLIKEAALIPLPPPVKVTPQMLDAQVKQPPSMHPVWHYTRSGHDKPHVLESTGGKFLLDGNPLSHEEVGTILDNVRMRVAKIRYVKPRVHTAVAKMERAFVALRKADGRDTTQHFDVLKEHGVPQDTLDHFRRLVYTDPMVGTMGNKYAWNEFKDKQKPGVYISMDGNDFKSLNDTHGHEAGDAAIKAFGNAAREAMDETVGTEHAKMFRTPDENDLYRSGGDEFVAHVPTHEHAAKFARRLREKLDAIPAINGTHKLSMSFGFGNDFPSADKALYAAKEQKYAGPAGLPGEQRPRKFPVGQVPSLAHSHVTGFEGPVPLNPDQLSPTVPKLEERASAPASASPALTTQTS